MNDLGRSVVRLIAFAWLLLSPTLCVAQEQDSTLALSDKEERLAEAINIHRESIGLPPIPISAALTEVARMHLRDLQQNKPHHRNRCNLHSWSKKGPWKGCCYTGRQSSFACMWNKPSELTDYNGKGYEIAYFQAPEARVSDALPSWLMSKGHRIVIENEGMWEKVSWRAMGVAIDGEYALVWFGEEHDDNSLVSPTD